MKSSESLAAWLGDRALQARTHQAGMDIARRWREHPLFRELDAELDGGAAASAAGVLAAAELFMDRRGEIAALFEELIGACRADPYFAPPLQMVTSEIGTGFVLYTHPALMLTLSVMSVDGLAAKRSGAAAPTSLTFGGRPMLYEFVRSGGATLSLWEIPAIGSSFLRTSSGRCRPSERLKVADGERVRIDGSRRSFVIEHATSDLVFLTATAQEQGASLSVVYDSRTLAFAGASSNDEASSRIQMMVTLLRLLDRQDAQPLLEQLLASDEFYVRWHVMREFLALDADAAEPWLRRMAAADPHAEVRSAAAQALAMFFDEAADEQEEERLCRA